MTEKEKQPVGTEKECCSVETMEVVEDKASKADSSCAAPAKTMEPSATFSLVKCALFVALMIVSCLVTIPIGPVSFTLQTAVAVAIVLLCNPRETALVMGTYLLMGTIGLPVFSGMTGGIIRASSGFLFGFFIGGVAASFLRCTLNKVVKHSWIADVAAILLYLIIDFALGWVWYVWFAGAAWGAAFGVMVAPFLLPDAIKCVASFIVAAELRKRIPQVSAN